MDTPLPLAPGHHPGDPEWDEPERRARRERMHLARRDARATVLDVALERFADLGVERTTIAMLCQDAEVGNGTIFHHFGDKHGIAVELARREWAGWYRAMLGASRRGREALMARQIGWAMVRPATARFLLLERTAADARLAGLHAHFTGAIAKQLSLAPDDDEGLALALGPGYELLRLRFSRPPSRGPRAPARSSGGRSAGRA